MSYKSLNNENFGKKWDFSVTPVFEGEYVEKRQAEVQGNNLTFYAFTELETGDEYDILGCATLNRQMALVELNARVKITFKGMSPSTKRLGKEFKNFSVEIWEED